MLTIGTVPVQSQDLSVPISTGSNAGVLLYRLNSQIIQASAGVSGDLNTIVVLAGTVPDSSGTSNQSAVIRYNVPTQAINAGKFDHHAAIRAPRGERRSDRWGCGWSRWSSLRFIPQPLSACALLWPQQHHVPVRPGFRM